MAIPYAVLRSSHFLNCTPAAIRLLNLLFLQYNGQNNGDITCAVKVLKQYGYTAAKIKYAKNDLLENKLLICTRQGHNRVCSLYAFTWLPIHECTHKNGFSKIDVAPTNKPSVSF